jgi:hypothetical protein
MYSYLNTLRLHDGDGGRTLTVGPKRRVVFRGRVAGSADLRKDELKRVLSPLKSYWGHDNPATLAGRERDPERPLMTFLAFKLAAKRLLSDAGMLRKLPDEDGY